MTRNIGFTCGAFDLFHAGHNILLRDCKLLCDKLIVGLHTDPTIDRSFKNKPIQTMYERYIQLNNCKWVDEIIPYDTEKDLINLLATTKINIRFIGEDYLGKKITGDALCEQLNIKVIYFNRIHNFSSSELRDRIGKAKSSIF
jgi:glycerol-3-phosphate cytidylyltransferase